MEAADCMANGWVGEAERETKNETAKKKRVLVILAAAELMFPHNFPL